MDNVSIILSEEIFAFVSWPNEGDGNNVSVISATRQRITGELIVGEECQVVTGKKQHSALVHVTGL